MVSKLPRWVWLGGSVLAFIAGIINAVGFLSFQHQGVTHLTGTTTALSIAIVHPQGAHLAGMAGILASFIFGATLCGVIVQDSALQLGRRYGVALIIESVMLIVAVPFLHRQSVLGNCLASCACGLQNAMATTYSGATVRTTHVSGLITDIGTMLGHKVRGLPFNKPRMQLLIFLTLGFFLGGSVGAILFDQLGFNTLLFPASLTGIVGAGYTIYRRHPSGHRAST